MNEPNDYMIGDGIFTRESGVLQPSARKLLEEVGSQEVKSLEIVRTPLSSFTKTFLNAISLGQFGKISKKYYDEMFHLSLLINGQYNLEKNEVVYFNTKNPKEKNSQVRSVTNIPAGLTIQQLIDNTRDRMGAENFSNYDAEKLNCQNFLINVFDANDIGDSADRDFIFQDATKIFKELPEYAKVLGKASVKLGAIFNRLIYGEGNGKDYSMGGYGHCGKPMDECRCIAFGSSSAGSQMGMGIAFEALSNDSAVICKPDEHYHPENKFAGENGCMKNHLMSGGNQSNIAFGSSSAGSRIFANGLMDGRIMEMRF
jgi:hypothetical protein